MDEQILELLFQRSESALELLARRFGHGLLRLTRNILTDQRSAEEAVSDPQVQQIVLFVIRDLDEEGKIFCKCPPDGEHEYDAEILPQGVRVTCKKCGASHVVPTNSMTEAHEFLNCDALYLK